MKKKFFAFWLTVVAAIMICFTSCTTEEQEEDTKEIQTQVEDNQEKTDTKQLSKEVIAQISEEVRLNQEAEAAEKCNTVMKQAWDAIEADDAEALERLQESEAGRMISGMAAESGSYLYFPDGGDTGKGIGLYIFEDCECRQWYYGDYKAGKREGHGIWYYVTSHTEDGSIYKEVYEGKWKNDVPNGKGHQLIVQGDIVETDQDYKVKNGLFYGTYQIEDILEDGTVVSGKYKLKKGKYVTISDEELEANHFAIPEDEHLAIAFLYDESGEARSCAMIYAKDVVKGVKHFYIRKRED